MRFFSRVVEWGEEFFINVCQFAEFTVLWQEAPILARMEREEMVGRVEEERSKVCV